ncbi:Serine/threonine-protein kinase PrkC [Symmachiella macrocystis]|uniref:non-specific serine/threonine protein kinase n=1 Tax=Symmachiella macrocystis TaxID=2527985 RepID=A0A5C6BJ51_9PLAN|nr:protein kinase [Symmachiella macrocystis]TWU12095.1 Serine/threonine-protein kinase PrkC [Symmachiella macrocystis]
MKSTENTCDMNLIDDYLDESLSDSAMIDFEDHLTNCPSCQLEIQQRAAEPEIWRDAVKLLGDHDCESSFQWNGEQSEDQRKRRVLSILESLMPTDDPEMLGRIGDYEVSGVVGFGGMGAVLKGFDSSLRRVVAIKIMAPHLADSGSARIRFEREARAAAGITHDNVVDIYGVSESNGLPYLVMPFARGPSLQKRIDESGPLTALEVVRIGRQLASGLAAAHEQGLVHRDIKPANILLNSGIERLWITDFGVARAMDDASMTQTGVIAGTPQFMSPEQARGDFVDQRSDLFSIGSVLYTACTGRPPFRSETAYGILRRITDTNPRPIREINPDIPNWLCLIIERLMAKHASDRYQSAGEVAELLERCLAHLQQPTRVRLPQCLRLTQHSVKAMSEASISEPSATRDEAKSSPPRIQRTRVWVLILSVLVAGVGFAAWQLTEPANIVGDWTGERWKTVSLSTVEQASGWYNGAFTDTEGRRGALQLEWSRMQRRYNGRWKVGNEQSGSLTLRVRGSKVQGAVSVDPDSMVSFDMPRLREFSWQRAPIGSVNTQNTTQPEMGKGPPTPIDMPIKGRIIRWGEGIRENALVKKGDLLAEVADLDPNYRNRLKEQETVAQRRTEAARLQVQASQNNLAAATTVVAALEAQLKAFQQVKSQVVAAAKASIESAENKVEAEKAELAEFMAARDGAKADYDRQKKLFDQRVISELKFQEAERKVKEAEAKVNKAEALVQAALNDLIVRKNDEKTKESKAEIEIDHATAQVKKAMGDVAKSESGLAKANLELNKAEKDSLELQTKISRESSQLILAPFSGFITKLTKNKVLMEGQTICLIWPDSDGTDSDGSVSAISAPTSVAVGGFAETSARWITETLGAVSAFGRRFRELRTKLRAAQEGGASQASVAKLKHELAVLEFERETTVAILKAQIDAAKKLNNSQITLSDMVKSQVENGDLNPYTLPPAEQAVVKTKSEIRELQLLYEYYTNLVSNTLGTPEDDRNIAIEVLKVRLEAARASLRFKADQSKLTRRRFELGDLDIHDVLMAKQAEAEVAVQVQKLEALLRYYEKVGSKDVESTIELPGFQDNTDVLIQPTTKK